MLSSKQQKDQTIQKSYYSEASNPLKSKFDNSKICLSDYTQEIPRPRFDSDLSSVSELIRVFNNMAPQKMPEYNFNINEIKINGLDIFLTLIMSVVALVAMHFIEFGLFKFLGYLDIQERFFLELKYHLLFYYKTYFRIDLFKNSKAFRNVKTRLLCLGKFINFWAHENVDKVTDRVIDTINNTKVESDQKKKGKGKLKTKKIAKTVKSKTVFLDERGNEIPEYLQ